MDVLTATTNAYMAVFGSYVAQFLSWGKWIFVSLLILNIVWMTLWQAFDKQSFVESMADFIKRFFVIALFYTIMVNYPWLLQMLKTATVMGSTLTHVPMDPSSLIAEGIGIGNKIIIPIEKSSILTAFFGVIIVAIVYLVILFVFISVALELAVTLIITTALISVSTFFLGFAALGATTQIARQTLDVILANCVKLLGVYLVIGAGSKTISTFIAHIPVKIETFDPYIWIVSAAVLFWLLAKNLPTQLARIVSGAIQETRGADAAALAMTAISYGKTAMSSLNVGGKAAFEVAKLAGSTVHNAGAHFNKAQSAPGGTPSSSFSSAVTGSAKHLAGAAWGSLSDQYKHLASKLSGGPGIAEKSSHIPGIAKRMHAKAKEVNSSYSDLPKSTPKMSKGSSETSSSMPSSSGRKAAASRKTRSSHKSHKSKPRK